MAEDNDVPQLGLRTLLFIFGLVTLVMMGFGQAFFAGVFVSIEWAGIVMFANLDKPSDLQTNRKRASFGFFAILAGIILAIIGPNYLFTSPSGTGWFVMWGLFLTCQLGLPLLLNAPLKRLSYSCGYLVFAIVLHSIILRFPAEFADLQQPKIMIICSLIISSWFLSQFFFFDFSQKITINETKNEKNIQFVVGIFSTLITIMEFINILYNLFALR